MAEQRRRMRRMRNAFETHYKRVTSPPATAFMSRLLASLANSNPPHRLVSVKAKAGYPNSPARVSNSWTWDATIPKE